jgi:uncharacterized protein YecT (DUF1311 family)
MSARIFAGTLPINLIGDWQVQEVHTNTGSARTSQYQWNDPRLRWRIFRFKNVIVTNDISDFKDDCKNPSIKSIETTFQGAMLRSIGGYEYPPRAHADPVADYRLNVESDKSVTILNLSCGNEPWQGDLGVSYPGLGNSAIRGAWMVLATDSSLYLRWRDETVLMLKKIRNGQSEKASFDCARAHNITERTICGSRELSGFDKSIADAYIQLAKQIKGTGENENNLTEDQRLWIKKRNSCNSNEKCILGVMRSRLEFLASQNQT